MSFQLQQYSNESTHNYSTLHQVFSVIYNLIIIYKIYNLINKDLAIAWHMDSVKYASIIFNAFSHLLC